MHTSNPYTEELACSAPSSPPLCQTTSKKFKDKKSLMFQGDKAYSSKKFKDRVTLLLTCSWSGAKMKPTLIGKSGKPKASERYGYGEDSGPLSSTEIFMCD